MKIISLRGSTSRDLYGMLECEHCSSQQKLTGGYDDTFWHDKVLPAFHCNACGLNRAGKTKTPEVTAANQAQGVNGI